jgi:hypothetical protein
MRFFAPSARARRRANAPARWRGRLTIVPFAPPTSTFRCATRRATPPAMDPPTTASIQASNPVRARCKFAHRYDTTNAGGVTGHDLMAPAFGYHDVVAKSCS